MKPYYAKQQQLSANDVSNHYSRPLQRLVTAVLETIEANHILAPTALSLTIGSGAVIIANPRQSVPLAPQLVIDTVLIGTGIAVGLMAKEVYERYQTASQIQDPEKRDTLLKPVTDTLRRAGESVSLYLGQS